MKPSRRGLLFVAAVGLAVTVAVWALDWPMWLLVAGPTLGAVLEIVAAGPPTQGADVSPPPETPVPSGHLSVEPVRSEPA
jgi:hypothetical protein